MARPRTAAALYQPVTLRFPHEILEQCRILAQQETRSLNEQVMHMVKEWLATHRKKRHDRVPNTP